MAVDYNILSNFKTVGQFGDAQREQALKEQLVQAQIAKSNEFDIDKVGQQAFIKASNGMPLNPTEAASLQYLDSKQQTMTFNPVTGVAEQRPGLLQRAGIGQPQATAQTAPNAPNSPFRNAMAAPVQGGGGDFLADVAPNGTPQDNQWDVEYQKQRSAVSGDPKAQHELDVAYAKSKMEMNESQSKNATYADRMNNDEPVFNDPTKAAAYGSTWQKTKDWVNPFGDQLNSNDYRSYNQAQKDFSTAKLRNESGAVINPSEFATDKQILYPQIGDSEEVLAQKALARETVRKGMARSAGPAYKTPEIPALAAKSKAEFDAKKGGKTINYIIKNGQLVPQ